MMRNEHNEDDTPFSRLFVVCNRNSKEEDLRPNFELYGSIEEFFMPVDKNTGELKGVAFVKYKKTSSAAAAIEALHQRRLQSGSKPLKVMLASNKYDMQTDIDEKQYKRLFIKVPSHMEEREVVEHFAKFGKNYVRFQKDKITNKCKNLAYVNYDTFLEAARAYEDCDPAFKAIFALPKGKDDLKRARNIEYESHSSSDFPQFRARNDYDRHGFNRDIMTREPSNVSSLLKTSPQDFDTVSVICTPYVSQVYIERLFNIIPGVVYFKSNSNSQSDIFRAFVKYDSRSAAAHAVETLNGYEFPSGQVIIVKPDNNPISKVASDLSDILNNFKNSLDSNSDLKHLANAIAEASTLLKVAATTGVSETLNSDFCNVPLPSIKPLAPPNSPVLKRCFIVFRHKVLPIPILQDAFCRFGDLIDVATFSNKTYGFARYASVNGALEAMKTLHGATLHGVTLKVIEAEERYSRDSSDKDTDTPHYSEHYTDSERKRAKLDDHDIN